MSHASTNSLPADANATLDLRDGDEAARAQVAKQQRDGSFAGQLRGLRPVLRDPRQVDVRDEVVGVGALEHQHLERLRLPRLAESGRRDRGRARAREDSSAGRAISAKRTAPSTCAVSVSKVQRSAVAEVLTWAAPSRLAPRPCRRHTNRASSRRTRRLRAFHARRAQLDARRIARARSRRASIAHGEHEKREGGEYDVNWPDYAAYMVAEQAGTELPT